MMDEANAQHPKETGGVLLGYQDETKFDVVVRAATGPGPNAIHERSTFVPDHDYHRNEVARIYSASDRQWSYVGDWHTHPEQPAAMSTTDRRTLRRIARSERARVARPIMLIMGQRGSPVEVGTWSAPRSPWLVKAWQYDNREPPGNGLTFGLGSRFRMCAVLAFTPGGS